MLVCKKAYSYCNTHGSDAFLLFITNNGKKSKTKIAGSGVPGTVGSVAAGNSSTDIQIHSYLLKVKHFTIYSIIA